MPSQVTDPTKIKLSGKPQAQLVDPNGKKGAATIAAAQKTHGFYGWVPDANTDTYRITDTVTPVKQIVNPDNQ